MRPYQYTTTALQSADDNGIALTQTPLAAGALTLAGVLVSGGVATITPAAFITATFAGNDAGRTLTIVGTSPEGWAQTATLAGANIGVSTGTVAFATVTSVSIDAASADAIIVGIAQAGYGEWLPLDIFVPNYLTSIQTTPIGTINYTWEVTDDNIWGTGTAPPNPSNITAFDHPDANLVAETAAKYGTTVIPWRAVRFKVNSGSGTARNVVMQQSTQ